MAMNTHDNAHARMHNMAANACNLQPHKYAPTSTNKHNTSKRARTCTMLPSANRHDVTVHNRHDRGIPRTTGGATARVRVCKRAGWARAHERRALAGHLAWLAIFSPFN